MKLSPLFKQKSVALAILMFGLVGCGGSEKSLSGSVTHNGQPVGKGSISFYPEGGAASPVGGDIVDGKYSVKGIAAGKYRVLVASQSKTVSSDNMDEAIKAAKAAKAAKKSGDDVAANDDGNNQVHDVTIGVELNLTLKTATGSGGRQK